MAEDQKEVSDTLKKVYEMISKEDSEDQEFAMQQALLEKQMAMRTGGSASHSNAPPSSPPANRRISALFGGGSSGSANTVAQRSSRADDVQFAAEVSENLLLECRRQQVQIKKLEQERGTYSAELESLRQKLNQAEQRIDSSGATQEQLREANWSLELQLQEAQALLAKQGDAANKWTQEAAKLKNAESSHLEKIDQLTSAQDELTEAARSAAAKHDNDAQTLRHLVDELEEELAIEKNRVATLESSLKRQTMLNPPQLGAPRSSDNRAENEDELTTPTNSPPTSPIKATPMKSTALENDTQRASLSHLQRQLQTMRTALQREKNEKLELKRQLVEYSQASNAGGRKKKARPIPRTSARPLSFTKRGTPSLQSHTTDEDGDDEFDFESAAESIYETADSAITGVAQVGLGLGASPSTDFFSVDENLDDTDSGQETPTGEIPAGTPRTSFFRRIFTKSPQTKADLSTEVESESNASFNDTLKPLSDDIIPAEKLAELVSDEDLSNIVETRGFELVKPKQVLPAGFVAVSRGEYEDLNSRPSVKSDDAVVLSKQEHAALIKPDIDTVKSLTESEGYVVITSAQHQALVEPSFEEWSSQASKFHKSIVDPEELAELQSPTLGALKNYLQKEDHVAVPAEEHKSLLNPSLDILQTQAESHGHVVLSMAAHETLVNPTLDTILQQALNYDHVVLSKAEHKKLEHPELDAVFKQAESYGHVVVPEAEYKSLVNPELDTLRQHANTHNHVLLSREEHSDLLNPAIEKLQNHAENKGHILLSAKSHERLRRPSLDSIQAQLDAHNHVMVPREEHNQLLDPTLEKVAEYAVKRHHVVVPEDEYDRLKSPTFLAVTEEAKKHNHVLVSIDEYSTLSEPDVSALREGAKKLHHVLLSDAEFEALKSPDIETISRHVKSHDHVLLSQDEYEALANPSLDRVKERAGDFKHIAIPTETYKSLLHPDVESLRTHAASLNHAILSEEELEKLEHPPADKVSLLASSHSLSVIADDELAKLRREAEHPTRSELEMHAAELDLAVTSKQEIEELQNPPSEKIHELAKRHNLVLLSAAEHEDLISPSREMVEKHLEREKPSLEVVRGLAKHHNRVLVTDDDEGTRSLAAQHGLAVLTADKLEELQNPSLQRTVQELKRHGYEGVPIDELQTLRHKIETPSLEELKGRADSLGFAVVPVSDSELFTKLKQKFDSPTEFDLEEIASKRDFVALPRDVYERLEETTKNPDEATIVRFAKQHGLEAIPVAELEALKERASKPTREDIDAWAYDNDHVTLPTEEYEKLVKQAESKRKQTDLANLSVAERREHFESLIKNSRGTPTKSLQASPQKGERMTETLKSLGYVPLPQDEYRRLLASQTVYEPTKGDIMRSARTFGMTALPTEEYRSLLERSGGKAASKDDIAQVQGPEPPRTPKRNIRGYPDESFIATPSEDEGLKVVPGKYLDTLRRIAEAPTREDLDGMAKRLGLELYKPDEVVDITALGRNEDTENKIKQAAREIGMTELLSEDAIKQEAVKLGFVLPLSDDEIKQRAAALGLAEPLDEESIKLKAKEAGLVEPLEDEDLKAKAKELGLVEPISDDELMSRAKSAGLIEPSDEEIRKRAIVLGLAAPLDVEAIKEKAKAAGMVEPISDDEIRSRALAAGLVEAPSNEQIKFKAMDLGLVLPLDEDTIKKKARASGLVEPLSQEQILARAKSAGLVEPLTVEEVKVRARAVGLVDPISDAEVLARAKKQGWVPPLSDQDLLVLIKNRGLTNKLVTPEPHMDSSSPSPPTPTPRATSIPPRGSSATVTAAPPSVHLSHRRSESNRSIDEFGLPTHLGATRQLPVSRRFEIVKSPSVAGRGPRPAPARSSVIRSATTPNLGHKSSRENLVEDDQQVRQAFNRGFAQGSTTISRSSSQRSLQSNLVQRKNSLVPSMASGLSIAELDHPTTMSFVTQLVIGELLYKYVSGFSLHAFTGGRHERYFWIHPYSLTLFWDKENPAVGGRSRYTGPKSAAILDVTEITDRNPNPPGLYYKSLVFTTSGKSVKVTCPSRRRHLIWYRGVKYLLEKAREESEMAEKDEEEEDTPQQQAP